MNQVKSDKVTIRFDPDLLNTIVQVARMRRQSLSDLIRLSVMQELARHSYFDKDVKKALGFESTVEERP